MNIFKYLLTTLTICILSIQLAQGAHIIGGVLYYKYLSEPEPGINRYEITMKLYRDAAGGGAFFDAPNQTNPALFSISTSEGSYFKRSVNFGYPVITGVSNVPQECLNFPPNLDVEEGVYTAIVDLPVSSFSYFVTYTRCCRNIGIANILNPQDIGITVTCEITPNSQFLKNSSPIYKNFPPIAICNGYPITFDHSATDIDGDSLVYEFSAPYKGGSPNNVAPNPDPMPPYSTVDYRIPYNEFDPLGNNAIKIDLLTGILTGIPTTLGKYVVGVSIKEYRNGQLLTQIIRDFQFLVVECQKKIDATVKFEAIQGKDLDLLICGRDSITLKDISTGGNNIFAREWQVKKDGNTTIVNGSTLNLDVNEHGIYDLFFILNNGSICSDTVNLKIRSFPGLDATYSVTFDSCDLGPIIFENNSKSDGGVITDNFWYDGTTLFSSDVSPTYKPLTIGQKDLSLIIKDINGCQDTGYYSMYYDQVEPLQVVFSQQLSGCAPFDSRIYPTNNIQMNDKLKWHFGDGETSEDHFPNHIWTDPGVYSLRLELSNIKGCKYDTTFKDQVNVKVTPKSGFDIDPTLVSYLKPTVNIKDQSTDAADVVYYSEAFGQQTLANFSTNLNSTGIFNVLQVVTALSGCQDSLSKTFEVFPDYTLYLPTAFSPDDDGNNDVYKPVTYNAGFKSFQMNIVDRYGKLVFQSSDPNSGWDGNLSVDRPANPGVYSAIVKVINLDGRERQFNAAVHLIR